MFYYKRGSTYTAINVGIIGAEEISKAEYERVKSILKQKPVPPDGYGYRLTESLEWELYELPPVGVEEDPELSDSEALEIIVNGGSDNA